MKKIFIDFGAAGDIKLGSGNRFMVRIHCRPEWLQLIAEIARQLQPIIDVKKLG